MFIIKNETLLYRFIYKYTNLIYFNLLHKYIFDRLITTIELISRKLLYIFVKK